MKWLALSLLLVSGAASADADSFAGFYGGVGVGGARAKSTWTTNASLVVGGETVEHDGKGAMGGLQWGYRAALGSVVRLGFELAWYAARIEKSAFSGQSFNTEYTTRIHDPASVALQLGLAGSHTLLYARGGWTYAGIELQAKNHTTNQVAVWEDHATGWTAGGGLDVKLRKHWSLGLQYDYSKLRANDLGTTSNFGFNFSAADFQTKMQSVLLRVNYLY